MNTPQDLLHHFLFENTPIRGNIAKLDQTYIDALQHQSMPPVLAKALGELMTASALLISTLKMEGALILQLQSKGILKLLVVECNSDLDLRATAKWSGDIAQQSFIDLIEDGQFVITLDPKIGEAYQGIVPLEGDTIATMLENYMLRSQQIDTSIWLHCDGENAAGLLLQKLPNQGEHDADTWHRVNTLANTVTPLELKTLSPEVLLQRLFHEEDVRLFNARPIKAFCSCTRDSVVNMLKMLGKAEVDSIIEEQGSIQVNCDFCNKHYVFDELESTQLFDEQTDTIKH
ncbi:MAG TPA: Hsp33 family molecular chaperone HslO [Methylophilus sp.]